MFKLETLLSNIYNTNGFYQNIIEACNIINPLDIKQYPILTRKQLQENRHKMFSDGYKTDYIYQRLMFQKSSGTSGIPVNIYWEEGDYYRSMMPLWRRRFRYYGVLPTDRHVKFTLPAFGVNAFSDELYSLTDNNILTINCSSLYNEEMFFKAIRLIENFQPVWLYIQPFILNRLVSCYMKNGILPPASLKLVESVGEVLPDYLKQRASNFFNVPLANMYGSEEMNGIAYECPFHRMHVLDDNVLVECLVDDDIVSNGEGVAILTNLNNYAMPLIRYNQGDIISINTNGIIDCLCGISSPVISTIKGRVHECVSKNGFEISSLLLCEVVADVNNQLGDVIKEYKHIYSESANELCCYIVLEEKAVPWASTIKSQLKEAFISKVPTNIDISYVIHQADAFLTDFNRKTISFERIQ